MRLKTCSRCGRPFEPRVSYHGLCPGCEPHGRDQRSPTTRAQDAEYAAERGRVLVPGAVCHYCGAPAATTDHVVSVADGGRHRGNLVPCCASCNASKQAGPAPRRHGASPPAGRTSPAPTSPGPLRLA